MSKRSVLILEDSRADRARFSQLLGDVQNSWEFAWAWQSGGGASVLQWFERKSGAPLSRTSDRALPAGARLRQLLNESGSLQEQLLDFSVLLVDLAWSNRAEFEMQKLQLATRQHGVGLGLASTRPDANDGTSSPGYGSLKSLIDEVEGLALLEWLKHDAPKKPTPWPKPWVTSAYVPTEAAGVLGFLNARYGLVADTDVFHKWLDEKALKGRIEEYLEACPPSRVRE